MKSIPFHTMVRLRLESLIQKILSKFGFSVLRVSTLSSLRSSENHARYFKFVSQNYRNFDLNQFLQLVPHSTSERGQDLLAVVSSGMKKDGFFVEFGAADGIENSNTYLLEKNLGWQGILSEPAKMWHRALAESRQAHISHEAVWTRSGVELLFHEDGGISALDGFQKLKHEKRSNVRYSVETVSLQDLLKKFGAPRNIDFLSIDTEGSELEILRAFDWGSYSFGLICVEHNFSETREKIHLLLKEKGYRRFLEDISGVDDWYEPANAKMRS